MIRKKKTRTNLIATGWLEMRLTPRVGRDYTRKGKERKEKKRKKNTFKNNTKGPLANLFSDTEVISDDTSCGCRLGRMGGRGSYDMWSCHTALRSDRKGKEGGQRWGREKGEQSRRKMCQYALLS
jgi:hypothetical protein